MKLIRRSEPEPVAVEQAPEAASGKGRATPKRRDATGPRGPVSAPKNRKEAYARQRNQAKVARTARRTPQTQLTAAQRRAMMKAGDPSVLPRRDQGPTRRLARDYVDSHRMFSNYLLLLFPLMIVTWLVPQLAVLQILVLVMFVGFVVEWYFTGRRIRRLALERFDEAQGGNLAIGFYAGSRAYLRRKWRLPAPQVELGDAI